ncbi:MAG: hypothetical protein V7607_2815 [Solirubrobacteraceae bacterium]
MSASEERDWTALAHTREFRELMASRRRFLVSGTVFYCSYFVAFLCLLGFAPGTMSESVVGSVSLALVLGMSLILLAFVMAYLHARKGDEWDRLAQGVLAAAAPEEPRFTKVGTGERSAR